jgi:hypothetical protein
MRRALIDGEVGVVWAPDGGPRAVFDPTIVGGRIVALDLITDPRRPAELEITILDR